MTTRQEQVLGVLRRRGEVSVQELAREFRVSPITMRRDLQQLAREQRVTRTHGGAVLSRAAVIEFAFRDRAEEHTEEKRALARHVAGFVEPGMSLVLDTGTTTLEVARALAGVPRLRVLTTSLAIASALYACENLDLVLLGGTVGHNTPDLSGPLTEENLGRFRTDLAVLGADAVDAQGAYTTDLGVARISEAMLACARESWLVVDSSKFTRRSFVRFAPWSALTHVVTDEGLAPEQQEWVQEAVRHLHVVPV